MSRDNQDKAIDSLIPDIANRSTMLIADMGLGHRNNKPFKSVSMGNAPHQTGMFMYMESLFKTTLYTLIPTNFALKQY